jgi:predicted RNase H-like HicB family nuclease
MKFRAVIKQVDEWWIGWLIDLPGVNAQEKTQERLLKSLHVGAEEMLETEGPFTPGAMMTVVDIPDRHFSPSNGACPPFCAQRLGHP